MSDKSLRDDAEREWWAAWRKEDYSWDGLQRKPLHGWRVADGVLVEAHAAPAGATRATLQDYWRDQKDALIEGDGRKWTIAHVPMHWRDGSPAKAGWAEAEREQLQSLVRAKLEAVDLRVHPQPQDAPEGRNFRAQLEGCILFNSSYQAHCAYAAKRIFFEEDFTVMRLRAGSDFSDAYFKQLASWEDITGTGECQFNAARFLETAEFSRITFPGKVDFTDAEFFGVAKFYGTQFEGEAVFDRSQFRSNVWFLPSEITEKTARFAKGVSFTAATFHEDMSFEKAVFEQEVSYGWANFLGLSNWNFCEFKGKVNFERLNCVGVFTVHNCVFSSEVGFEYGHFSKRARFTGVKFVPTGDAGINFECVRFNDLADFAGAQFPQRYEHFSGAFVGAQFIGVADMRSDEAGGATWIAALDGALLSGKLLLEPPSEADANREFHKKMIPGAHQAAKADVEQMKAEAIKEGSPLKGGELRRRAAEAVERRLRELESGCRVVKLAMGRDRNEVLEQRYYRFQLIARRRQKKTPGWEKLFSHLYALTSDYGTSMVKPFAALAFSLMLFAAGYLSLGLALDGAAPSNAVGDVVSDAWSAATFSWNNTFRPLSALSVDVVRAGDGSWLAALLYEFGPGPGFGVRALATLQSLLAIVLAFLFALAVRRRFQIG